MADRLPVEVIAYIMRYVSVSDRKEAALVGRNWYEASLDPILLRDTTVTILASPESFYLLPGLAKRASHLVLENLSFNSNKDSVLKTCRDAAENLESISLKGSDITEKTFLSILESCYNLQKLDISCCNSMFMTGILLGNANDVERLKEVLTNVKEVNMSNIRYLSDITFNRMMAVCPNIERLSLTGNQVIFHSESYYNKKKGYDDESSAVVTFQNLMKFIKNRKSLIKALDLSRTSINDDGLTMMSKIDGLQLEEFRLVSCRDISDVGIAELCKNQPTIEVLDLTQCLDVTDASMIAICTHLKCLKYLNLSNCRRITEHSIAKLNKLPTLERLDISSCYAVSSMGLVIGLCKPHMTHVTHLNLSCCTSIRDSFVTEAAKIMSGIMHLDLGSCGITNKSVHFISKYLTRLRYLRLAWCKDVDDNGILGIKDPNSHDHGEDDGMCRCSRKKQFANVFSLPVIHGHHKDGDHGSEDPNGKGKGKEVHAHEDEVFLPMSNLTQLRTLDLTACYKITDESITKIMTFRDLQFLHISLCPKLTDETLRIVASSIPTLEGLSVSQCNKMTDEGALNIVNSCRRLCQLNISNLDQISNRVLDALYCNTKGLHSLDVSMCSNITPESVEMLENNLVHLKTVQKRLVGGRTGLI